MGKIITYKIMESIVRKITDYLILFLKKQRNKRKLLTKTICYLTFDEYIKDYNCSFYEVPTNFTHGKTADGQIRDLKECIIIYDEIVLDILSKKEILINYMKFKKSQPIPENS